MIWTKGVGGYGEGWGNSGTGISVKQGDTLYVKYYSDEPEVALSFANHGRRSGGDWQTIGPVLTNGVGTHPNDPIILRISDVGTSKSTVAWINGPGRSGIWRGPSTQGPFDLALHEDAKWTLPPIVVNEAPKRASFWSTLLGSSNTAPPRPDDSIPSVADGGVTAALFALALLSLAMAPRNFR
ncbi:MAG: hypothetical protein ACREH8_02965 [Opitutaceae bacterium]